MQNDRFMPRNILPALLVATLVAGTADILLAFLLAYLRSGISPDIVLRYIASAVYGREAFTGGQAMVFTGLLLHFGITFIIALIVFLLYPKAKWMSQHKMLAAVVVGVVVWTVMNLIVIPVTRARAGAFDIIDALSGAVVLILAIGYPLVFFAAAYHRRRAA